MNKQLFYIQIIIDFFCIKVNCHAKGQPIEVVRVVYLL